MSRFDDDNDPVLNPPFKFVFNCTKLTYSKNKSVERGGKLLLPLWVLDSIYYMNTPSPYLFKLTNESNHCYSHAGVLEFTAEEDKVCVPLWLMKHLGLKEGEKVTIESVALPSATYLKLLPLTRNTAYITDSEAVLEENLRNFSCLTEGDVLSIYETNKNLIYKIKVAETKPETAVSILHCNVNLDLDLPEKCKPKQKVSIKTLQKVKTEPKAFPGRGYKLDEGSTETSNNNSKHQSLKTSKKRKSEQSSKDKSANDRSEAPEINESEPQSKRRCTKPKVDSSINQLISIREKQKEFAAKRKQSSGNPNQFPGTGHSLKDK